MCIRDSGWPPQEPKKKMSVGVKVFIVILAVLAVVFIGGFAGFGIYVVVQQQNETSFESSDNHNSSQFSNNSILDEEMCIRDRYNGENCCN